MNIHFTNGQALQVEKILDAPEYDNSIYRVFDYGHFGFGKILVNMTNVNYLEFGQEEEKKQ